MSKSILVPTDFSQNAMAAARYAAQMAQQLEWSVRLLHTFTPFSSSFADEHFNDELVEHETGKAQANMDAFQTELQQAFPNVEISASCEQGLLGTLLPQLAGQLDNELVVMGTKGASGLKYVVLGSNTFEIIRKSPIPVLAVPESYPTFQWQNIGLLTNFKQSDIDALQASVAIGGIPRKLTLLHLIEKDSQKNEGDLALWGEHIYERTGIKEISCSAETMVNRMDVREDFSEYVFNMAESEGVDVLVVTHERKNFLSRLFSKSLVKAIAHQLKIPVFFHNRHHR